MERLANLGYVAVKKQTAEDTVVTPDTYIPIFNESLATNINMQEVNPIIGIRDKVYKLLQGQRTHQGALTVLGEPNVMGYMFDMLLKKGTTSGAGPYTHPYTLGASNWYTIDVLKGQIVFRYWGCKATSISPDADENLLNYNTEITAKGEFSVREIDSVATTTITLKTKFDPAPTKGLVAGDKLRIFLANGTTVDTAIDSITDTTIVCDDDVSSADDGDWVALRAQEASYTLTSNYFQFARSEFRFADTAANAFSATHKPVQPGASYSISHDLSPDSGELRSGSYDPATLIRTQGGIEANTQMFFDTPEDHGRFLQLDKRALVIRHFAGDDYELRITMNNIKAESADKPLESGGIIYDELTWKSEYDDSDGQAFDVKVLNNVSSI